MTFPYQTSVGTDATMAYAVPELWTATYLVKWHLETVFDKIVNTDYEGEFSKMGDTIHIRKIPDITIRDYYKRPTAGLTNERPTTTEVQMLIDKGKYWHFTISDVDKKQTDVELANTWATEAKRQMNIKIETQLFEDWADEGTATYNKGNSAGKKSGNIKLGAAGAPRFINGENIADFLTDVTLVLDEQNVPEGDRALVVPKFMAKFVKMSPHFTADKTGEKGRLVSGILGEIDGLMIYASNNVDSDTDSTLGITVYNCFACHKKAISFATQLQENEIIRSQTYFEDISRGLQIYGSKVTLSDGVVSCIVAKG